MKLGVTLPTANITSPHLQLRQYLSRQDVFIELGDRELKIIWTMQAVSLSPSWWGKSYRVTEITYKKFTYPRNESDHNTTHLVAGRSYCEDAVVQQCWLYGSSRAIFVTKLFENCVRNVHWQTSTGSHLPTVSLLPLRKHEGNIYRSSFFLVLLMFEMKCALHIADGCNWRFRWSHS